MKSNQIERLRHGAQRAVIQELVPIKNTLLA